MNPLWSNSLHNRTVDRNPSTLTFTVPQFSRYTTLAKTLTDNARFEFSLHLLIMYLELGLHLAARAEHGHDLLAEHVLSLAHDVLDELLARGDVVDERHRKPA